MEAARDLVAVIVEFTAGMELCKCNFRSASLGIVFVIPFDRRWNAAAIINDRNRIVGVNRDLNVSRKSCKRLI